MKAKSIPLQEWQAPQEDVVLHFSEGSSEIYFRVWNEDSNLRDDIIGRLSFEGAWSVRSVKSECCPYLTDFEGRSSILEVVESDWYKEIEMYYYSDFSRSTLQNNSRHYIVKGHDIFFEILAEGYKEEYINKEYFNFPSIMKEL